MCLLLTGYEKLSRPWESCLVVNKQMWKDRAAQGWTSPLQQTTNSTGIIRQTDGRTRYVILIPILILLRRPCSAKGWTSRLQYAEQDRYLGVQYRCRRLPVTGASEHIRIFYFFIFLSATFFSPSGFSEADGVLFLFLNVYSDFFKTNYLNIHRTDLYEICRDGRTLSVREDLQLFSDTSREIFC